MNRWKIDLAVMWFCSFFVMGGMTMVIPFLPLYLQELGIDDPHKVAIWAGFIFAANFVTLFAFQPLWGKLADRYGRKVMLLRSCFGMAIIIILMGFAQSAWQLLALRLINGVVSGFNPAAVSLISASAPKERMGFAMGTLQSGVIAGTITGPLFGGLLADVVGFRPIFYMTGAILLVASLLVAVLVREKFDRKAAAALPQLSIFKGFGQLRAIPQLPALFTVTLIIQFALLSTMPVLPLFIQQMHPDMTRLALFAGLVGSVAGLSNMIAAPLLGRLADKIGAQRVLGFALLGATVTLIPQAFATTVWQLLAARFMFGLFLGGIVPSVQSLIRRFTPDGMESRAFAFNSSFLSVGNLLGPIIGGFASGLIGIPGVFLMSAALMLVNAIWVYYFTRAIAKPS